MAEPFEIRISHLFTEFCADTDIVFCLLETAWTVAIPFLQRDQHVLDKIRIIVQPDVFR